MSALQLRLSEGFAKHFGGKPDLVGRAPARVNLIGEHTDYNDGFALPLAIGAETRVALRRRGDGEIRVVALNFDEHDAFLPVPELEKAPDGGWRDYIRGTVAILARAGVDIGGLEIAVAGDVPMGTGLSSSASLEVAIATAVLASVGRREEAKQVALWAQAAENDLSACAAESDHWPPPRRSRARACSRLPVFGFDPVKMPSDAAVMIVQSGAFRVSWTPYNERRRNVKRRPRSSECPPFAMPTCACSKRLRLISIRSSFGARAT